MFTNVKIFRLLFYTVSFVSLRVRSAQAFSFGCDTFGVVGYNALAVPSHAYQSTLWPSLALDEVANVSLWARLGLDRPAQPRTIRLRSGSWLCQSCKRMVSEECT